MAITTYAELQTAIATNWLNRSDLDSIVVDFITLAEARFKRDPRVRSVFDRTFSVTADDMDLPTDLKSVLSLYHDGDSFYGELECIPADLIGRMKGMHGDSGVPKWFAVVNGKLRMAPEPDTTYDLKMTYDVRLQSLSTSQTSNWLLTSHPDIYLYGALIEASPYLKDDTRIPIWEKRLETALEELNKDNWRGEYGGSLRAMPRRPIG